MTKKRAPKKPKVVWVGGTPITPITAKERRKIQKAHPEAPANSSASAIPRSTARS